MNEDLKAYVDGELPAGAAERLRERLKGDHELVSEEEAVRRLSEALRSLPHPPTRGMQTTLAAVNRPRGWRDPFVRGWAFALVGCAALAIIGVALPHWRAPRWGLAAHDRPIAARAPVTVELPTVRARVFARFVRGRGGYVRWDGAGLRAFYGPDVHEELIRRFDFPTDTPWATDGLRIRLIR